jgi:hypothetical protein
VSYREVSDLGLVLKLGIFVAALSHLAGSVQTQGQRPDFVVKWLQADRNCES